MSTGPMAGTTVSGGRDAIGNCQSSRVGPRTGCGLGFGNGRTTSILRVSSVERCRDLTKLASEQRRNSPTDDAGSPVNPKRLSFPC